MDRTWNYIVEAFSSLTSRVSRSMLAMVGIIIAVSSVITLYAVGEGARTAVIQELTAKKSLLLDLFAGEIVSDGHGKMVALTDYDVRQIKRAVPGVTVVPAQLLRLPYKSQRASGIWNVTGIPANGAAISGIQVVDGEFFNELQEQRNEPVMVLGFDLAAALFTTAAEAVGARIQLNGTQFLVVGTVKAETDLFGTVQSNTQVFIPLSQASKITGSSDYWKISMLVRDKEELPEVEARVLALLKNLHPGATYHTEKMDGTIEEVDRVFALLTRVLLIITGISLVVGGIGVTNVMLMAVTERVREIGVRRAIGATRRDIVVQFLFESCILCLSGGVVGLLLSYPLVELVGRVLLKVSLVLNLEAASLALGLAFTMGILCGGFPAFSAASVPPAEALRVE